ncbi:uncharacterized protein LOC129720420 [Wyeomyia smithii]|uniref:uncharacterized protein LOC129720420 n=1 Tax=Wyeomyia smithii TaxID=174621 RepID=UPI002467E8A9|nr:uncharacterized protein LOC129720420 [Wyeomyia smithii]
MAADVADSCYELGIVLVVLYPNTTRITQPADVAIFKPLKNAWKNAVSAWRDKHNGNVLTLIDFSTVLQEAMKNGIKKDSIVSGFKTCGLYPFDPDVIDYSKCIAKSAAFQDPSHHHAELDVREAQIAGNIIDSVTNLDASENPVSEKAIDSVVIPSYIIDLVLKDIGEERLNKILLTEEMSDDEIVIKNIYEKLIKPYCLSQRFTHSSNEKTKYLDESSVHPFENATIPDSFLTEPEILHTLVNFQSPHQQLFEVYQNDSFGKFNEPDSPKLSTSNDLWNTTLELCTEKIVVAGKIDNVQILTASNNNFINLIQETTVDMPLDLSIARRHNDLSPNIHCYPDTINQAP